MLNTSLVTEQIADYLANEPAFKDYRVTRSEPINLDHSTAALGWIGIYKDSITYEPLTLGSNRRYKPTAIINIVIQRVDVESGEFAEDKLEQSVQDAMEAMLQIDRTYIRNFEEWNIEYGYITSDRETYFFQQAIISLTCELVYQP